MTRPGKAALTRAARPVLLLAGSGVSAVTPIATLAIAAQTMSERQQGLAALALSISAYVAQLVGALLIEGPLAEREGVGIRLPRWFAAVAVLGVVVLAAASISPALGVAGVLLLYPALELTRVACVVNNDARSEGYSAVLIIVPVAAAVTLSHLGAEAAAWPLLALGGAAALVARRHTFSGDHTRPAPFRTSLPILAETAATGAVQPILLITISAALGPLAAVGFRALTSLGGLMSPALGFLRLRLLSHNAGRADRTAAVTLLLLLGIVVIALGRSPLLFALFGDAWNYSTYAAVSILVAWRLMVAAVTFPFARLRRAGRTTTVLKFRIVSSALLLALSALGAHHHGVTGALAGLLLGEFLSFLLYQWKASR